MKINKDEVKEKIRKLERHNFGLDKISGVFIKVLNLKIRKDKYIADIVIREDESSERYNNCEYPKKIIEEFNL